MVAPRSMAARRTGVRTPRQRSGDEAEKAAAEHLLGAGCRLIARNVRYREGELDLIVQQGDMVVFVEVRLRSGPSYGGAAASVDFFKQKRLTRAAQHWLLQQYGQRWPSCRFDVVTVDGDGRIEWLRDAFGT
jgi:putative endonuclease